MFQAPAAASNPPSDPAAPSPPPPRFDFHRDTLAFPNQLLWTYRFSDDGTRWEGHRQQPRPRYTHRCFVLARLVHLFAGHAGFRPDLPRPDEDTLLRRVLAVLARNPRSDPGSLPPVMFAGWTGLRELSRDREPLLKQAAGGAWRSYVLRSHWRMIFPITRAHQARTAKSLVSGLQAGRTRVVHIVRFPSLTINHALMLYSAEGGSRETRFLAYDPNDATGPVTLSYSADTREFRLPATRYWPGGRLDVIEIFRSWCL